MTSNKRAIGILLGMLILAMVVGAVLNRERSGRVLTALENLLTTGQTTQPPAPEAETPSAAPSPTPSVTPSMTPVAPEPAEPSPPPQVQNGPMPWEELTPEGTIPAWRKNALVLLYKNVPDLIPEPPRATPDAAPMPEKTGEEPAKPLERTPPTASQAAAPEKTTGAAPGAPGAAQAKSAPRAAASQPAPSAAAKSSPGPEGSSAQPRSGLIAAITLECGPSECTLRIETKPPLEHIAYFHKIQPARLALDLYGNWIFRGPNTLPGDGDFVERIRLGQHPDRFRVVLDFKGDQNSIRKEPVIENRGNTLLVKIAK